MSKLVDLFRRDAKTVTINGVAVPAQTLALAEEIDRNSVTHLVIENDEQYAAAAARLVETRRRRKQIEELLNPIVESANKAHKAACTARKALTDALTRQEDLLGNAMSVYDTQKALAARQAQAAVAEQEGVQVVLAASRPKTAGLSTQEDYEAVITDAAAVPIEFNGIILRPVDQAALNRLAKMYKGAPSPIPGVEFRPKFIYRVANGQQ